MALIVCVVLFLITAIQPLSAMPITAAEVEFSANKNGDWVEEIPKKLQSGDYREGVVFAGIDLRKAGKVEDVVEDAEEVLPVDASAGNREDGVAIICIQRDDMTTEQILKELAEDDRVLFAEPDYFLEDMSTETAGKETDQNENVITDSSQISDLTPLQWSSSDSASFHAEGIDGGVSINVPNFDKQDSNMEGDPVVVAVIDAPIDFNNPDLKDAAYTFTEEEQALLGCDVHGYNATWQSADGKLDSLSGADHGTHCAGIIGASWNGHGTSGVASNVKLVSIQHRDENKRMPLINILRGLAFIKKANEECDANIRIASCSWGFEQSSRALDAAIRELGDEQGVIFVFAAGNDGVDLQGMESLVEISQANPYVVVVTGTNPSGELSGSGSYNDQIVTMGAPGNGIFSTVPLDCSSYIPEATLETNKFYEGFETGDLSKIKLTLLDDEMNPLETHYEIIDSKEGMGFAGEHVLRLELDPEETEFTIQMELDLSGTDAKAGDYLGFAFGENRGGMVAQCYYYDEEEEDWGAIDIKEQSSVGRCFGTASIPIPEGANLSSLKIAFLYFSTDPVDSMYLDSVDVGSQTVPYAIMSGTSMACPAVAGGATILASRFPEAKGAELAQLVRASVRNMPSLAGKTRTGGILDLSVDVTPASDQAAPVINRASLDDLTLTLEGIHFGSENGTVTLTGLTAGVSGEKCPFSVSSWSDTKVVLDLEEDFKGIAQVSIKAKTSGKQDSYTWFVGSSDRMYGTDLPLNKETGDPFVFDAEGDKEIDGPLLAYNGKLYYLPMITIEDDPASGAGARIANLKGATENPRVTVSDGVLYVYNRNQYTLESVDLNADEDMKGREYTLPKFVGQPEPMDSVSDFVKSKANAVLVPVSGGVFFLGPAAADGSSDTYLLKTGESKLTPCGKRITEDSFLNLTAAADQDSVYVIASAMIEPEGRFFRSEKINNIVENKDKKG